MPNQDRLRLSKLLQYHGYSACREALVLLEDHYTSSTKYESLEDFISKLNRVITFNTDAESSIITPELAYVVIKKLSDPKAGSTQQRGNGTDANLEDTIAIEEPVVPTNLTVKVKCVQYSEQQHNDNNNKTLNSATGGSSQINEFNIHYNFLLKRLNSLPIFQGDFQLTSLAFLTASTQPSVRCICFGLLIKDLSKIDMYTLIDSSGRIPVRITPDTTFRNRLAYANCIVLIEGVYINPNDVLFAANIGLPPILLDPILDKSLACTREKLVIVLKELYLDDSDVCDALDMLFTGYNSLEDPPLVFILIGDFTRNRCEANEFRCYMKKLARIIRSCENLRQSHFVFVPGARDTSSEKNAVEQPTPRRPSMPKAPLSNDQFPLNLFQQSNFENIHLATNPVHIYLGDRHITVVAHSYFKELRSHLLHDLTDHREELFETCKQIILSNAHLAAGITKNYHSSMNLWHKPDLLVLADTEAYGNRYDYDKGSQSDTSFMTVPSFAKQSFQFKVYYVRTGDIEDSQVSSEAIKNIEILDDNEEMVELCEEEPREVAGSNM